METHLYIELGNLPEEGKSLSGELDQSIFDFPNDDTEAKGPLLYDIHVQQFETELLVRGSISVPIQFTCVRSLNQFVKTLENNDLCVSVEITSGQIDLASALREELLILAPDYPRCNEGDEPMECILDSRYLAVDNPPNDDVKNSSASERPDPWEALDAIKNEEDEDN